MSWQQHAGSLITQKPVLPRRLALLLHRSSYVPSSALFYGYTSSSSFSAHQQQRKKPQQQRSLEKETEYASLIADTTVFKASSSSRSQGYSSTASISPSSLTPSTQVACQLLCDLAFLAAPMVGMSPPGRSETSNDNAAGHARTAPAATGNQQGGDEQLRTVFDIHFDKIRASSLLTTKRFIFTNLYTDSSSNTCRILAARCLLECGIETWSRVTEVKDIKPHQRKHHQSREAQRVASAVVHAVTALMLSSFVARVLPPNNNNSNATATATPSLRMDHRWYGVGEAISVLHWNCVSSVTGAIPARDAVYQYTTVLNKFAGLHCAEENTLDNNNNRLGSSSAVARVGPLEWIEDDDSADDGTAAAATTKNSNENSNEEELPTPIALLRSWTSAFAAHMTHILEKHLCARASPLWIGNLLASDASTLSRLHGSHMPHTHALRHHCTKEVLYLNRLLSSSSDDDNDNNNHKKKGKEEKEVEGVSRGNQGKSLLVRMTENVISGETEVIENALGIDPSSSAVPLPSAWLKSLADEAQNKDGTAAATAATGIAQRAAQKLISWAVQEIETKKKLDTEEVIIKSVAFMGMLEEEYRQGEGESKQPPNDNTKKSKRSMNNSAVTVPLVVLLSSLMPLAYVPDNDKLFDRINNILRLVLDTLGFFTVAVARHYASESEKEHSSVLLPSSPTATTPSAAQNAATMLIDGLLRAHLVLQRAVLTGLRCIDVITYFRCVRADEHPFYGCFVKAIAESRKDIDAAYSSDPHALFRSGTARQISNLIETFDQTYTAIVSPMLFDENRDAWTQYNSAAALPFPELRRRDYFSACTESMRGAQQGLCMLFFLRTQVLKDRIAATALHPLRLDDARTLQLPLSGTVPHSLYNDVATAAVASNISSGDDSVVTAEVASKRAVELPGLLRFVSLVVNDGREVRRKAVRICRLFATAEDELRLTTALCLSTSGHRLHVPVWEAVFSFCAALLRHLNDSDNDQHDSSSDSDDSNGMKKKTTKHRYPHPTLLGTSMLSPEVGHDGNNWKTKIAKLYLNDPELRVNISRSVASDDANKRHDTKLQLTEMRELVDAITAAPSSSSGSNNDDGSPRDNDDGASLAPLLFALAFDFVFRSSLVLRNSSADGLRFDVSRHVLHALCLAPSSADTLTKLNHVSHPLASPSDRNETTNNLSLLFSLVDPQLYALTIETTRQLLEVVAGDSFDCGTTPTSGSSPAATAASDGDAAAGSDVLEYGRSVFENSVTHPEKKRRLGWAKAVSLSFISVTERKHAGGLATEYLIDTCVDSIYMCRKTFVDEARAGIDDAFFSQCAFRFLCGFNKSHEERLSSLLLHQQQSGVKQGGGEEKENSVAGLFLQQLTTAAPFVGIAFARLAINTHTAIACFTTAQSARLRFDIVAQLDQLTRNTSQAKIMLPPQPLSASSCQNSSSAAAKTEKRQDNNSNVARVAVQYEHHCALLDFSCLLHSLQNELAQLQQSTSTSSSANRNKPSEASSSSSPSSSTPFKSDSQHLKVFNTVVALHLYKHILPLLPKVVESPRSSAYHAVDPAVAFSEANIGSGAHTVSRNRWLDQLRGVILWMTPVFLRGRHCLGASESLALFDRAMLLIEFFAPSASVPLLRDSLINGAQNNNINNIIINNSKKKMRVLRDIVFASAQDFADAAAAEAALVVSTAAGDMVRRRATQLWDNNDNKQLQQETTIKMSMVVSTLLVFAVRRLTSVFLLNISVSRYFTQTVPATQTYIGRHRPEHMFQLLIVLHDTLRYTAPPSVQPIVKTELAIIRSGLSSSFSATIMLHLPVDTIIAWSEYLVPFLTTANNKRMATKMLTHVLRRSLTGELLRGNEYKRFSRFIRLGLISATWGVVGQTQAALCHAVDALLCMISRKAEDARGGGGRTLAAAGAGAVTASSSFAPFGNVHCQRMLAVVREHLLQMSAHSNDTGYKTAGSIRSNVETTEDFHDDYMGQAYIPELLHMVRAIAFVRENSLALPYAKQKDLRQCLTFVKDQMMRDHSLFCGVGSGGRKDSAPSSKSMRASSYSLSATSSGSGSGSGNREKMRLLHPVARIVLLRNLQAAETPLTYAETRAMVADVAPVKAPTSTSPRPSSSSTASTSSPSSSSSSSSHDLLTPHTAATSLLFPYPWLSHMHHHISSPAAVELLGKVLLRSQIDGSALCSELASHVLCSVANGALRSRHALHDAFEVRFEATPSAPAAVDLFDLDVECDPMMRAEQEEQEQEQTGGGCYATAVSIRHTFLSPYLTEEDSLRLVRATWQFMRCDHPVLRYMGQMLLFSVPPCFPTDALIALSQQQHNKKTNRKLTALKFTTFAWFQAYGRCFVGQWAAVLTRAVALYLSVTYLRRLTTTTTSRTATKAASTNAGLYPRIQDPGHVVVCCLLDMNGGEDFFLDHEANALMASSSSSSSSNQAVVDSVRHTVGDSFIALNQSVAVYSKLSPYMRCLVDLSAITTGINGSLVQLMEDGVLDTDVRADTIRCYGTLLFYAGKTILLDQQWEQEQEQEQEQMEGTEEEAHSETRKEREFHRMQLRDVCVDGPSAIGCISYFSVAGLRATSAHLSGLLVVEDQPPYVASNALAVQQVTFIKGGMRFSSDKHFSLVLDTVRNNLERGASLERILGTMEVVLARTSEMMHKRRHQRSASSSPSATAEEDEAKSNSNSNRTWSKPQRKNNEDQQQKTPNLDQQLTECITLLGSTAEKRAHEFASSPSDCVRLMLLLCDPRWGESNASVQRLCSTFAGIAQALTLNMSEEEQRYCMFSFSSVAARDGLAEPDATAKAIAAKCDPYLDLRSALVLLPLVRNTELRAFSVVQGARPAAAAAAERHDDYENENEHDTTITSASPSPKSSDTATEPPPSTAVSHSQRQRLGGASQAATRVLLRRWIIVSILHNVHKLTSLQDISIYLMHLRDLDRSISQPTAVRDLFLRRLAVELVEAAARHL